VNGFQAAYLIALACLTYPAWRGHRFAVLALWGNMVAMLAASLAMDLGALDRGNASLTMMIIDLATGVALATRPGLERVIAAGYAVTVPLYVPLIHGLFTGLPSQFTLVYLVSALQIGALAIGTLRGHSGGGGRRLPARGRALALPQGDSRLLPGNLSRNSGETP